MDVKELDEAEKYLKRLERRSRVKPVKAKAKPTKKKQKSSAKPQRKVSFRNAHGQALTPKEERLLQRNIEKHRRADEECQAVFEVLQKLAEEQ